MEPDRGCILPHDPLMGKIGLNLFLTGDNAATPRILALFCLLLHNAEVETNKANNSWGNMKSTTIKYFILQQSM